MVKQHLKRLASPRTWPIEKKRLTFVARPNPGPHKLEQQVPIVVLLRDVLKVADTAKEVKYILHNKDCLIDGAVCHDEKRPVGIMDVLSLPKLKKQYRLLVNNRNTLTVVEVPAKEASTKITKVIGKSTLKGGKVQLNCFDGRNFIIDKKTDAAVGDSIVTELPAQKIVDTLKLQKGSTIMIDAGSHVGKTGLVESVEDEVITVKVAEGELFRTKKEYAIVIGKSKPLITLLNK